MRSKVKLLWYSTRTSIQKLISIKSKQLHEENIAERKYIHHYLCHLKLLLIWKTERHSYIKSSVIKIFNSKLTVSLIVSQFNDRVLNSPFFFYYFHLKVRLWTYKRHPKLALNAKLWSVFENTLDKIAKIYCAFHWLASPIMWFPISHFYHQILFGSE